MAHANNLAPALDFSITEKNASGISLLSVAERSVYRPTGAQKQQCFRASLPHF